MPAVIPHSRPWITAEDRAKVVQVLDTGMLASGAGTQQFEHEVASYLGASDSVACASGTAALALAIRGLGIGVGDEVVCPSYVCHDVVAAIHSSGAAAVLCDLAPDGWCADAASVERVLTKRTRAVVAVHVFGTCADVGGMSSLGVPIIEDCAHALGSSIGASKVGTLGAVGFFSFHATKMLSTGEGGALVTRDRDVLDRARRLRESRDIAAPLSDLAAALGRAQLARFPEFLARRTALARRYFDGLPEALTARLRRHSAGSSFFRFPLSVRTSSFASAESAFASRGISVRRGVDALNHRRAGLADADFPHSVERFETTLSLPLYPALSDADAARIVDAARAILGEGSS